MKRYVTIRFRFLLALLLLTATLQVEAQVKAERSVSKKVMVAPKRALKETGPVIKTLPGNQTPPSQQPSTPQNPSTQPPPPTQPQGQPTVPSKERRGPANIPFFLTSQIDADREFNAPDVLHVFNTVYRDANMQAGYYYFLPASYNLSWTSGTGKYDFNATYSAANANGRGETTVTAILKPKTGSRELKFVRELVEGNINGKPEASYGVTDLIAMPMAQAPEIAFSNLGQFGVETKDISIRAPSDLMDPIYISFTTGRIDDLMGMFFNNIGLYGDVIVYPAGEGMPASIRIPFNLKIDDAGTFGRFELLPENWRTGWQNKTDFPVVLTHFNVLKKEPTGNFKIYTWQTGDPEVPEQARVKFDASRVPAWIDQDAGVVKMWMDYTVKPCVACNNTVKEKIIKGTSGSRVRNIDVTILTPLEFTAGQMLKVRIRSFQADPNGLSKADLPTLTITKDNTTMSGGQLFVPDGATPDFEYMLQVFMPDGTRYESDQWKKASDLDIVVGTSQVKEMISHFK
ncbi:hypothetical protein KK062_15400 [Fulvivirgaceae bacterium PWU5]|uniref:Uncharacterized protein n=1 Tax=Dawidia cretensis TaxID=2782350 RepID=A0AAP2DYB8_9BACT|nr:hypothetical protein [Dawidia cretensis]MBT1709628.1 hypothetical protein [Dawidia cretensis]